MRYSTSFVALVSLSSLNIAQVVISPNPPAISISTGALPIPSQLPSPCLLGHVARLEANGTTTCLACDANVQLCTLSSLTGLTTATKCNFQYTLSRAGICNYSPLRVGGLAGVSGVPTPSPSCQPGFVFVIDPLSGNAGCGHCDSLSGECFIVDGASSWTTPTFCAPGYSFSDGVCSICSAGSFANFNTTSCSNCTLNTYSAAGAGHCSTCAPGSVSPPISSSCTSCTNGTYATPNLGCVSCMAVGVTACSPINGTVTACLSTFTFTNGACLPKITNGKAFTVLISCKGATIATIKNNVTSCTPCGFGVAACSSVDHSPTNLLVLGCLAGFYYSNNQCTKCNFGNGSASNNTEPICSKCDNPAATRCSTKPLADIACTTGYYLRKGVCTICGSSTSTSYDNSNPTCINCPGKGTKDCDFNVHPVNILSCVSGYIYSVNGNVGVCTTLVN